MSNTIIPYAPLPVNSMPDGPPSLRAFCARCGHVTTLPEQLVLLVGRTYQSLDFDRVVIIDPRCPPVAYCPDCSSDLRVCSFCGCTDECACPGGCSWVQEDICSACIPKTSWSGTCHRCGHAWPQTPGQNMCRECGAGPLCRMPDGSYAIDLVEHHPIRNGSGETGDRAFDPLDWNDPTDGEAPC
jgi:hypothetical protein